MLLAICSLRAAGAHLSPNSFFPLFCSFQLRCTLVNQFLYVSLYFYFHQNRHFFLIALKSTLRAFSCSRLTSGVPDAAESQALRSFQSSLRLGGRRAAVRECFVFVTLRPLYCSVGGKQEEKKCLCTFMLRLLQAPVISQPLAISLFFVIVPPLLPL